MTTNNHLNDFVKLDSKILEEHSKTADELLKVEHLDSDNTKYLASVLFCLGRYDESIEQFEKILSQKRDDTETLRDIGINHFKKRDYPTAIGYFAETLEKSPGDETALSYKMLCHEFSGDYTSAAECGKQILEINPENTPAIKRLIDYHLKLKDYDACLDCLNRLERPNKYKKALILYEAKRYEECIELSGKIRTAESYHLAGKSHQKLGNTHKAVKYLYKSYEMDFNIDTLFEISEIYLECHDHHRAIHYLKKVLVHDDSNVEAYEKIALAYLDSAKWHDSIEYCRKALKISKKRPQTYITLANAYFQIEVDFKKPNEILDEGIKENPNSAELWTEKGGFNFPTDIYAFMDSYEKALSLDPGNCKIYREYINLLLMNDDDERAKKFYNEMLLYNPLFEKSFDELKKY